MRGEAADFYRTVLNTGTSSVREKNCNAWCFFEYE
jgi:hypothetical protein